RVLIVGAGFCRGIGLAPLKDESPEDVVVAIDAQKRDLIRSRQDDGAGFAVSIKTVDDYPGSPEAERGMMRVGLAAERRVVRPNSTRPVVQRDHLGSARAWKDTGREADERPTRRVVGSVRQLPSQTSPDIVGAVVHDDIGVRVQRPRERIGYIVR